MFDQALAVGPDDGNFAYFGRNVLRGLVDGIDDFISEREARWRRFRGSPALLGSAPWIDDEELLAKLGHVAACIVMTKQTRDRRQRPKLARLHETNAQTSGMPLQALVRLGGMAPKEEGKPATRRSRRHRPRACPLALRPSRCRQTQTARDPVRADRSRDRCPQRALIRSSRKLRAPSTSGESSVQNPNSRLRRDERVKFAEDTQRRSGLKPTTSST